MGPATGWSLVAQTRARELKTRIILALFIGGTAYGLAPSVWPLAWFAAMLGGQLLDLWATAPLRRAPDTPPTPRQKALLCGLTAVNTAVYSGIAAYLWFYGGLAGQIFGLIQVAGGLLHVTLHMHKARPLLFSALVPHGAYFLGLPLVSGFTGQPGMIMGTLGGLLYCAHLAVAVRQARTTEAELQAANDKANDERDRAALANSAKSDFLATISHEIRTPMNAVLSAAELLKRTDLTPEQAEHVAMLTDAGDVLMGLLNDVLDISKIEAGKMQLETADLDLSQKLESLVRLWDPRARDKGVSLRLQAAPDLPGRIRTDPLRLQQILFNLLSNAVKFTDAGEIALHVGRANGRLWFEVVDSGCGVAPEAMERLFAGFEQADAGTTRRYGGTGLGLTISRRLAELMGGALTASSVVGAGSTFRLELPLVEASAPAAVEVAEDDAASSSLNALRVLVAEDHAVNRRIVSLFLEPLGCRLTMAENGREAVELAEAEAFDVILMDMQMPVMDGPAATRTIRDGGGPNAATPVIALTANALDHHRAIWAEAGVETFLTKPIDPRALTAALMAAASAAPPAPAAPTAERAA